MSGKNREKSGNFEVDDKWQPWKCVLSGVISLMLTLLHSGCGCSKLMMSLVNVSLKFQTLIHVSNKNQYILLKTCEKLLHCKSFSHFFNKKYQCIWLQTGKILNELTS